MREGYVGELEGEFLGIYLIVVGLEKIYRVVKEVERYFIFLIVR